uniref:Uncharacterized protein n=1 Tax=Peronospora matthiolae TaxID=2874970 RepID=A0AAV1V5M1_9STRA
MLFLETGFTLDEKISTYCNDALELGLQSAANMLKFLGEHGIHSKGAHAVLKQMRALYRASELNGKIQRYRSLLWSGAIGDPAPGFTQAILEQKQKLRGWSNLDTERATTASSAARARSRLRILNVADGSCPWLVTLDTHAFCVDSHLPSKKRWVVPISVHDKYDVLNVDLLDDASEGRLYMAWPTIASLCENSEKRETIRQRTRGCHHWPQSCLGFSCIRRWDHELCFEANCFNTELERAAY